MINSYLVADIGGTNARCATARVDSQQRRIELHDMQIYRCRELRSVDGLFERYRADTAAPLPANVCLAVAGPVHGDAVSLTNNDWNFSIEQVRRRHRLRQALVINDLAAVAAATRFIGADELQILRAGRVQAAATRVVLGAGTGLGVAALLHTPSGWHCVPSEAGHAPFAAGAQEDRALLEALRQSIDFVSWETLLSGAGLVRLYEAVALLSGQSASSLTPIEISQRAARGDPLSEAAVRVFCRTAACFASSAAVWFCSFGGVYLSGDIFRSLAPWLAQTTFFDAVDIAPAIVGCVDSIPISLVLSEQPSLIGAAVTAHEASDHADAGPRRVFPASVDAV